MQKIIMVFCLATFSINCIAQDSLTYVLGNIAVIANGKEVTLNETIPSIKLDKIVNYTSSNAFLESFTNKPCILIFWHQFCPTCRQELQKLEAMKSDLAGKINILLVTFQSRNSVIDFIASQRIAGRQFSYPCVVEDTLLRKTFPHDGDPHLVWINTNRKVQAITDYLPLNKENLQRWLATGKTDLPYRHLQKDFDYNKPLLVNNNGGPAGAFEYRSLLTGFIDSISATSLIVKRTDNHTKVFMANATIDQMFKQLFIQMDSTAAFLDLDWMDKRVLIDYKNASVTANLKKAFEDGFRSYTTFQQQHLYTYELILPNSYSEQEAMHYMLQDIERYFHIHASIEQKQVDGLALKLAGKGPITEPTGGEKQIYKTNNDSLLILKQNKIWSLVNVLNLNYHLPVVVDETGYDGTISVQLNFQQRDQQTVTKDLLAQHFVLEKKEYAMNVLVLTDKIKEKP